MLYDTVRGLDKERYDIGILAMRRRGPYFQKLRNEGFTVESLEITHKFSPAAFFRLIQRVLNFRPDIIHAHLFHADMPARLASVLVRQRPRPVFISHQHIPEQRFLPHRLLLERISSRAVDAFVCVSRAVADHLQQSLKLPATKLRILPNGRDLAPFEGVGLRPAPAVGELWKLGTVGRLDPQKDHELLLKSLAIVHQKGHRFTLKVAGEGDLRGLLEERTRELGLGEMVEWLGRRDDVPELLRDMHLFVMSSRYEGLPIAAIEAMAAGVPIVATDVPGLSDVLVGDSGALVPYGNAEALAEAIIRALTETEESQQRARRAQERAFREYSRQRMIVDLNELYGELLDARSA